MITFRVRQLLFRCNVSLSYIFQLLPFEPSHHSTKLAHLERTYSLGYRSSMVALAPVWSEYYY